jgi:predicted aspartyl protease
MKKFDFEIPNEEDVIIVEATINNKYDLLLGFDTAATHTTIDSNLLFLSGYDLKNSKGEVEVETSNGIVIVEIYELKKFECLGIEKENFEVHVYDFLAHGITSNYHGVVGLNFLKDRKFCIDMRNGEILID